MPAPASSRPPVPPPPAALPARDLCRQCWRAPRRVIVRRSDGVRSAGRECEECALRRRQYYHARVASGRCAACRADATPGRVHCEACRQKMRDYRQS